MTFDSLCFLKGVCDCAQMAAMLVVTAFQDSLIGDKMFLGFKDNVKKKIILMWLETRQYHSRS